MQLHLGGAASHEVEDLISWNHVAGEGGSEGHLQHLPLATLLGELENNVCRQGAIVEGGRGEGHVDHPAGGGRALG